jgi:hypothetical protein
MALTIQQLYDKYTGREADLTGLQFWTEAFLGGGDTVIDANDEASFARAVAAARAQGTEPAAVKPVATTATTTATTATPTTTTTATPATPAATTATTATTSAPINLNNGTFLTAAGKIVDASGNVLADTGYAATATLTQQILGQNLTDRWQGQGWGTAQANASDMARMMATAGITDIKQFGVIPDLEPVVPIDTLYNGKRVFTQTDEDGKTSRYIYEPTGKTLTYNSTDTGEVTYPESRLVTVPKDAKLETVYGVARDGGEYGASYVPVDQSKIKTVDGKLVGDTGKTTFGNKVTGQAIANNYETGSNAFGGTTAGKGNTGYRVQFAPDGTPLFYTTGASSSDIGQLMPLIQIGLAASGAGGLLGNAILGTGASEIATGALGNAILGGATAGLSGNDILQGALLGGAGGALSGYLQGGTSALDAGMGVYPNTGNIIPSALDAGMGVYPSTGNIIPSALDAGLGVYPNTGNIGSSTLDAGLGSLTDGITSADIAAMEAGLPPTGSLTAGITTADIAAGEAGFPTSGSLTSGITVDDIAAGEAGLPPTGLGADLLRGITSIFGGGAPTGLTTSDIIRIIGAGTTLAGINAATNGGTGGGTSGGTTQYPIVNVPTTWTTPPKPSVATATVLPQINFGDKNLLRGTQWEKFLDPKYGLVPEPIKYSKPSSLSYNDLMGILGSKQDMPLASTLSINDIISGIQNQYGQTRTGTMG